MKTCLIVIDVQESFRHRPFFTERDLPAYLQAQNALIDGCVAQGIPVLRVFHSDGPEVAENPFSQASGQVRALDGLAPFDAAATFTKSRHSALVGTGLDVWLTRHGIQRLIISGIRTEQCCETTTRHASDLGWDVDYVTDATLTWDMVQPDGQVLAAADIKTRTATVLQGRFATLCTPLQVAILVFDEVEALDLGGPYEVFTTASRMHQRQHPDATAPFVVQCVARSMAPVRARAGLRVLPDADFASAAAPDVLIVPGGVVDAAAACPATRAWVAQAAGSAQITASVCTGAFILAAAGVLTEGPATTHWEDIADLRTQYPALDVLENLRWVDRGALVTSAGISAGIDMSLHLVTRLLGAALSERTARQMDTPWNPQP
eukprot:gene3294-3222_t